MTAPLTIAIHYTRRNFYRVQARYLFRKQWWVGLLIGITFGYGIHSGARGDVSLFVPVLAGLMLGISLVAALPLLQWRSWRKNPNFSARVVFTFSESGFSQQSPVTTIQHDWKAVKRLVETQTDLLIQLPPNWFYFLPKEQMSGAQIQELREALSTWPPPGIRFSKAH